MKIPGNLMKFVFVGLIILVLIVSGFAPYIQTDQSNIEASEPIEPIEEINNNNIMKTRSTARGGDLILKDDEVQYLGAELRYSFTHCPYLPRIIVCF